MSSAYKYYTDFRKKNDAFTIVIERIKNNSCAEQLLILEDSKVIQEIPENLCNYYAWAAIAIKKHIKDKYKLSGTCMCSFYSNYTSNYRKKHAHIVIDCDSNLDLDAPVYQC